MVNFIVRVDHGYNYFVFDGYTLAMDKNEKLIDGDDAFDASEEIQVNLGYPLKEHRTVGLRRIDIGWTKQAFAECLSEVFRCEWIRSPDNFSIEENQEFVLVSAIKNGSGVWHLNILADKLADETIKEKKEVGLRAVPPWATVTKKPARKR